MAGAQLGITICSLGLGAIGEPAVAHLLEPLFHAVGVPETLLHPIAFVIALAVVVGSCTSCSARWCRRTSRSPARSAPRCSSVRRWWSS